MDILEDKNYLVPELTVPFLLLQVFNQKKKSSIYYFDPGSHNNGLFFRLIGRLIGLDKTTTLYIKFFKLFFLELRKIERGKTKDYPDFFLKTNTNFISFINKLYKEKEFSHNSHVLSEEITEAEALLTLDQKITCHIFWPIFENIELLRKQNIEINFLVNFPKSLSLSLKEKITKFYNIHHYQSFCNRFSIVHPMIVLFRLLILSLKSLILATINRDLFFKSHGEIVITEFFEKERFSKLPGEPNYLEQDDNFKNQIIYYLSTKQDKLFSTTSYKDLRNSKIIPLVCLILSRSSVREFLGLYYSLFKNSFKGNYTSEQIRYQYYDIEKYIGLKNLFKQNNFSYHLYSIFPNTNSGTREDSSFVTFLCHKYGMKNSGFQSRSYYSDSHFYFFNYEDIRFTWSFMWDDNYKELNNIDKYVEIGNLYDVAVNKEIREAKKVRNLVIFTSDIDSNHVKTPYTNEYCLRFLQIIFDGIGLLKQDHNAPSYNVYIKTKFSEHINILENDECVTALLKKYRIHLTFIRKGTGDTLSAMQLGDVLLSTGFTTTGIEGLTYNKPSAYVSSTESQNVIFRSRENFVLTNEKAVYNFLRNPSLPDEDFLKDIGIGNKTKPLSILSDYLINNSAKDYSEKEYD